MAENLVIYTILHQPRRLKLPAEPIRSGADPAEIERCLFDEAMNESRLSATATTPPNSRRVSEKNVVTVGIPAAEYSYSFTGLTDSVSRFRRNGMIPAEKCCRYPGI